MIQASREDDHELVRSEAKKAIYKIGHPITADPPISSLKNENNIISEDAADPREYDHLVEALKDKTWEARLNKALRSRISGVISGVNARGLGEIKDVRAVDPLIRALKDKRRQIRDAAARALGEIKNVKAVDPLIQALNDRSWCVRIAASWALGEIGDDRTVDHLNRIISDDQNIFVREEAKVALERIKKIREVAGGPHGKGQRYIYD